MNKKRKWIWIISAFVVFLFSMFVIAPQLQKVMENYQPYLLIDPDVKGGTGCKYDYATYVPVELTGRNPNEGVKFPVESIPEEYMQYVHYPESWNNPYNPFNPENNISQLIVFWGRLLIYVLGIAFLVYLIVLWRRGRFQKMKDKLIEKDD